MKIKIDGVPSFRLVTPCDYRAEIYRCYMEEIIRMLEESGTESSWLMQYLFEEQNGEPDSETPW